MTTSEAKRAVILLSGGLDSSTCLAIALSEGFEMTALSFDYGQRHRIELDAARRVLAHYGVQMHLIFDIGCLFRQIGGSSLTDQRLTIPSHRTDREMANGIPTTYVPARNLVFLSYALGIAESVGAQDIFFGANAADHTGYPDCRLNFVRSFEKTANFAILPRSGIPPFRIRTPLMGFSKAQIIRLGTELEVPYHLTHSCYAPSPGGSACGACDPCLLRHRGFEEAGVMLALEDK